MNQKITLLTGAICGGLGVALGAFGAHALKNLLTQNGRIETYELAVRYQFYHAIAILIVGVLMKDFPGSVLKWSALLMFLGVVIFSGSLYVYSLTNIKGFAMITPIGGLLLLIGWVMLAYSMA